MLNLSLRRPKRLCVNLRQSVLAFLVQTAENKDCVALLNASHTRGKCAGYEPCKLYLLQGTNPQEPITHRSLTEADLEEYAQIFSGQRPKDDYVNLPQAPRHPPDPECEKDTSTSILGFPTRTTFSRLKLAMK